MHRFVRESSCLLCGCMFSFISADFDVSLVSFGTRSSGLLICCWLSVVSPKQIPQKGLRVAEFQLYCQPELCCGWPSFPTLCHFMLHWSAIERLAARPGSEPPGRSWLQSVHCLDPVPTHSDARTPSPPQQGSSLKELPHFCCEPLKIHPHRVYRNSTEVLRINAASIIRFVVSGCVLLSPHSDLMVKAQYTQWVVLCRPCLSICTLTKEVGYEGQAEWKLQQMMAHWKSISNIDTSPKTAVWQENAVSWCPVAAHRSAKGEHLHLKPHVIRGQWFRVMFILCSVKITDQLSLLSFVRLVQAGVPRWLTRTPSQGPW